MLGKDRAAWETVEPDMSYHVRHIDIPAPGSKQQFDETVSFLNTSLLDRGHKVHHSLIDGEGGLRVMRNFLGDSPRNKTLAGPWMAVEGADKPRRSRPSVSQVERLQGMLKGLSKLPGEFIGLGSDVVDIGAQSLSLKPRMASLPFTAKLPPTSRWWPSCPCRCATNRVGVGVTR
jgi:diacylglycerol O-acyltransferase / wax synthase